MRKFLSLTNSYVFIFTLLIIAVMVAGVMYVQYTKAQDDLRLLKENPNALAQAETKDLITQVSKLIDLPSNEEPTVATVTDKNKIKDQPFFLKAENGDKVLIYTQAKKAILYRPGLNRIIEVAPLNIGQSEALPLKLVLYNGTTIAGLTLRVEESLKEQIGNIEVVAKENANRSDYTETIVVDLSGTQQSAANSIAQALGGSVGTLPVNEVKPNADILVILGSN